MQFNIYFFTIIKNIQNDIFNFSLLIHFVHKMKEQQKGYIHIHFNTFTLFTLKI